MKSYLRYILYSLFLVYLIIVVTFVSHEMENIRYSGINVSIDHDENAFINAVDVCDLIKHKYGNIVNRGIDSINTSTLEDFLNTSPMVKNAQVSYSLDGKIHINIIQRTPLLRVMSGVDGYYVDEEGEIMPLSSKYTSKVIPVTGTVSRSFAKNGLFRFVSFIKDHTFWSAYIEQIVVEGEDVLLIPKVGDFQIRMGNLLNYEDKLDNLKIFIEKGVKVKGWNYYKEINLKYENQVVCVKK